MAIIGSSDPLKVAAWQKGFSLLQLAVIMMILGLMLAGAADVYKVYQQSSRAATTAQRMADIREALRDYFIAKGALPCPADPSLPLTSANYGASEDCAPTAAPTGGVIRAPSARAIPDPFVRIGAVPVRALGLPDSDIAEATNHDFIYAVTESIALGPKTLPVPFPNPVMSQGGIDIQTPGGTSLLPTWIPLAPPACGGGQVLGFNGTTYSCVAATSCTIGQSVVSHGKPYSSCSLPVACTWPEILYLGGSPLAYSCLPAAPICSGAATFDGTACQDPPGSALYVLISPGADGKGAWYADGSPGTLAAQQASCATAPAYEKQNCIGSATFNGGGSSYSNQ